MFNFFFNYYFFTSFHAVTGHKFLFLSCWLLLFTGAVLIPRIWTPVKTPLMLILYRPTIRKEVSGSLFYTLSLYFECVLCWDKVWMKEFANYEILFHTMLLHQLKTFLFPTYHHFYLASSSVHSFSSALSLRFVWSQGNLSPLAASPCNCLGNFQLWILKMMAPKYRWKDSPASYI